MRHMHWVYVARQLEGGVVLGEQGGAGRENDDVQEKKRKSHNWLPAEDNLQLATVELPAVRQAHDALLVARQVRQVHLLNKRQEGIKE